jgi:hypothetical protein
LASDGNRTSSKEWQIGGFGGNREPVGICDNGIGGIAAVGLGIDGCNQATKDGGEGGIGNGIRNNVDVRA